MASPTSDARRFDPTLHQPPRIDKFGYVKDNALKRDALQPNALSIKDKIKMPEWWGGQTGTNPRKTLTELVQ